MVLVLSPKCQSKWTNLYYKQSIIICHDYIWCRSNIKMRTKNVSCSHIIYLTLSLSYSIYTLYHIMMHCIVSYCTSYRVVSFCFALFCFVSFRFVLLRHIISYIVSYRFVLYQICILFDLRQGVTERILIKVVRVVEFAELPAQFYQYHCM